MNWLSWQTIRERRVAPRISGLKSKSDSAFRGKGTSVGGSVGRRTRGRPERARDDRDQPMACRLLFPLRPPRPFLCVATITQSDGRRTDELPIWGRVRHSYVVFLVKFEGQFVYTIIL